MKAHFKSPPKLNAGAGMPPHQVMQARARSMNQSTKHKGGHSMQIPGSSQPGTTNNMKAVNLNRKFIFTGETPNNALGGTVPINFHQPSTSF